MIFSKNNMIKMEILVFYDYFNSFGDDPTKKCHNYRELGSFTNPDFLKPKF
jgi:hypothetical protein